MEKLKSYIKEIRVTHYLKNILILLPLFFSGQFLDVSKIINVVLGFFSFSFLASIIYIINDLKDLESDRNNEFKKNRPIASGKISTKEAYCLIVFLFLLIIILNYVLWNLGNIERNAFIRSIIIEVLYLLLNIAYSFKLKHIPIVDVVILVSGFILRVLYGAEITGIIISNWLYLTVMSGSFFLGFGKRRNEILKQGGKYRDVLQKYNLEFLDKYMYVCLVLAIVFYSLWCIDAETISRVGNSYMIYTIPLVLIILMKYSLNIEGDSYGDPIDVVLKDKILLLLVSILAIVMVGIMYI